MQPLMTRCIETQTIHHHTHTHVHLHSHTLYIYNEVLYTSMACLHTEVNNNTLTSTNTLEANTTNCPLYSLHKAPKKSIRRQRGVHLGRGNCIVTRLQANKVTTSRGHLHYKWVTGADYKPCRHTQYYKGPLPAWRC